MEKDDKHKSLGKLAVFAAAAVVLVFGAHGAGGETRETRKPCKDHPMLSGSCYAVRGRMTLANGTPSIRIWPVGTRRILGVSEGRFFLKDYRNIPDDLAGLLTWENAVFADFTVCPFTDDRPGVMRFVCVESAENVEVKSRK